MALTDELSESELALLRRHTLEIHYEYFPHDRGKRVVIEQVDMMINQFSRDAVEDLIRRRHDLEKKRG